MHKALRRLVMNRVWQASWHPSAVPGFHATLICNRTGAWQVGMIFMRLVVTRIVREIRLAAVTRGPP